MKETINYKDIICTVLKKIVFVVVSAIVFAVLFAGYKGMTDRKAYSGVSTNILDPDTRLAGESDEAYSNRVKNINQANELMETIEEMSFRVQTQNDYCSRSILLNLDPLYTAHTEANLLFDFEVNTSYRTLYSLYSAYERDILTGDYITEVAEEIGCSPELVSELIDVEYSTVNSADEGNTVFVNSGSALTETMTITVKGASTDFTDMIMDRVLDEVNSFGDEIGSSIMDHSFTLLGRSCNISYDQSVYDRQYSLATQVYNLQAQINNQNVYLDNLAKLMGLPSRDSFYMSSGYSASGVGGSTKDVVVFGLIGFVIGGFLAVCILVAKYFWGRRIDTQSQFFCLFPDIVKIGICKPIGKKSKYTSCLERISGDDNSLTDKNSNAIIACNYNNLTKSFNNVLITGFANPDTAKDLVKNLGIKGELRLDMFENPEVLKTANDYEGIVLLEQRGVSNRKAVREEIELLNNSSSKIVGVIIL